MANPLQIIKYEGDNETLVYKQKLEDLNSHSRLIVNESQEALFYKSGQALDLFGPGDHALKTENLPFIKKIFAGIFGGPTPFPCEIYFINKVNVLKVLWGIADPIQAYDAKFHIPVNITGHGEASIRIKDSRKFMVEVVGQLPEYTVDNLVDKIRGQILPPIKEYVDKLLKQGQVDIFGLSSMLSDISKNATVAVNASIADFGIEVGHLAITALGADDEDLDKVRAQSEKYLDVDAEAYKIRMLSQARAEGRMYEGTTYSEERRFNVLDNASQNEGGSGFVNMGVGLGVGVGLAGNVGKMTNDMMNNAQGAVQPGVAVTADNGGVASVCANCGAGLPAGAKFCVNCGTPQAPKNLFCPQCGNKCEPNSKFCCNCGAKLG